VLRAHADGRLLQYYLEKGDTTNAHLLVEILAKYYQVKGGKLLTEADLKQLLAWEQTGGLDVVLSGKCKEALHAHQELKAKK
jgi:hypothetical protein